MTKEDFEIKILKPYLDRFNLGYHCKYRVTLCDGSEYRLDVESNIIFQKYMVEMAKLKL